MDGPGGATSPPRCCVRQTHRRAHRRIAGDLKRGGVSGCQLRVRNSIAHPLVPPTPTVADQSGGESERGGAVTKAMMTTAMELRSVQSSGCLSYRELLETYRSDAESRRRAVQLRRRRSAAATMAATRRSQAGQPESGRIIKMEPTWPTGAARERNRGEVHSPVLETKGGVCGRELQNPRFTSLLQGKTKIGKGLTTTEG